MLGFLVLLAGASPIALAQGLAEEAGVSRTVIINQSTFVAVSPNNSDGATALCGNNYPAGGGFEIKDASVPFTAHVYRSTPQFGTRDGWRSSVWNPKSAAGPVRVRSFTLCLKRLSDAPSRAILYPTETAVAPDSTKQTLHVKCAAGYLPVGGGFSIEGNVLRNQPLTVLGSYPTADPDGWAVEAFNPPGAPRITITATAVCLKTKASALDVVTSPTVLLGRQDAGGTKAMCPEGSSVVGGGFRIVPEKLSAYPASPLNSNPVLRNGRTGWGTAAVNTAPHPFDLLLKTNRVRAFALCLKG